MMVNLLTTSRYWALNAVAMALVSIAIVVAFLLVALPPAVFAAIPGTVFAIDAVGMSVLLVVIAAGLRRFTP